MAGGDACPSKRLILKAVTQAMPPSRRIRGRRPFGQLLGERRKIMTGTTIRSCIQKRITGWDRGISARMRHSIIVYLQKKETVTATLKVCGRNQGI